MKLWAKKSVIWSIILIIGVLIDVFLSLNMYLDNPEDFISRESNEEAIRWFTNGDIPWLIIMSSILIVLWISAIFYLAHRDNDAVINPFCAKIGELLMWCLAIFYLTARIIAGSTWYYSTDNLYSSFDTIKLFTPIVIYSIVGFLVLGLVIGLYNKVRMRQLELQGVE